MVGASLPDLGEPIIIALGAVLGSFLGSGYARVRRQPPEIVHAATLEGGFLGTGLALALYVFGLMTNLY